jgi:hypothetical protein
MSYNWALLTARHPPSFLPHSAAATTAPLRLALFITQSPDARFKSLPVHNVPLSKVFILAKVEQRGIFPIGLYLQIRR